MPLRVLRAGPNIFLPTDEPGIVGEALALVGAELLPGICRNEDEVIARAAQADGVLDIGVPLSRRAFEALGQCRGVVLASHGFNHVDIEAATELGIPVTNTYFCHDDVANHTMMLLLACARKLIITHGELVSGRWRKDLLGEIPPIYGQTLGIIGLGHIGRAVARRARAFDLHVVAFDPHVSQDAMGAEGVERVDLTALLCRSDFVSVHTPLSPETYHLIGDEQLRAMKPTAFVINTARGSIFDQKALARALAEGWIAGAGLDVFEDEPISPEDPLLKLPNVVLTPHAAGASTVALGKALRLGATNLARILKGRWPENLLNPAVKARPRFPLSD